MTLVRYRVILCITLLGLFSLARASQGWLRVVGAGDYKNIVTSAGNWFFPYGEVGQNYHDNPAPDGSYFNEYELASKGGRVSDAYSIADDFDVPPGKSTSKIMVAVQGGRSFSPVNTSNPSLMTISLIEHNASTNTPNHWKPPVRLFKFTAPVGGWHNMSFDNLTVLPLYTSTGFVPNMFDWFELDVSDLNNGAGLSAGKYWLDFKTLVSDNSYYDKNTNTWTSGNNYVIAMSYGYINTGPQTRIPGYNPGFGLRAKIPYIYLNRTGQTDKVSYENNNLTLYNTTMLTNDRTVLWRDSTTCQYDTSGAACDISMNVFLWTDVAPGDANAIQTPLPPPTCVRNSVPWPSTWWSMDKITPPNFGCPSLYYDYTDPSMGPPFVMPSPTATPSTTSTTTGPTPTARTPPASQVPAPVNGAESTTAMLVLCALFLYWFAFSLL
jgi:hypothetical protein